MKEHQEVAVLFVDVIVWDQLEHIYITTASDVMESMVDLEEQLEVAINSGSAWLGHVSTIMYANEWPPILHELISADNTVRCDFFTGI